MKKLLIALCALALVIPGAALSQGLPEDTPIEYPSLIMEDSLADELEMDGNLIGEDEKAEPHEGDTIIVKPDIGGAGGKSVITISTVSNIRFPSPFSQGVVDFTNPSNSTVNVQYLLRMSVAELMRQTGKTGYSDEDYAKLSAEAGFDPETKWVVLGQTKGIPPGKRVHSMTLGALPDGSTLAKGKYKAKVVMAAYDLVTNRRNMVGIEADVTLEVLSDLVSLTITDGWGDITLFNSSNAPGPIRFTLLITQGELMAKTGQAHAGESIDGAFTPAEYLENGAVTLFEMGEAQPGQFLEAHVPHPVLPDGVPLPQGVYTAWIARSEYDPELDLWSMTSADTQVELTIN